MSHETSMTIGCIAVLTVSDTRTIEDDQSGSLIIRALRDADHQIVCREIVRDERKEITALVKSWAYDLEVDAIIVNGGTGPSRRDVTPEAIVPLMDSMLDGFGEIFRLLSYKEIGAAAMLSRATAGLIHVWNQGHVPVFLLPGSPAGVELAMSKLIVPQLGHLLDICSWEANQ